MGTENGTEQHLDAAKRNEALISVLCKYLSINPDALPKLNLELADLKSICLNLVSSSRKENILGFSSDDQEEISRWLAYADSFHLDTNSSLSRLKAFDELLAQRSVLTGKGLHPSVADVVVWISLHDVVITLSAADRRSVPNLMRWFDYIQNKEDFSPAYEKINLEKPEFGAKSFPAKLLQPGEDGVITKSIGSDMNGAKKNVERGEAKPSAMDAKVKTGATDPSAMDANVKTGATDINKKEDTVEKKEQEKRKVKEEKKKNEEREPIVKKDTETSVTVLDIRVGVIRKAWKHPSADSLLVEEIDLGEEKMRQVVSGLAKYYGADELLNRRVLVVTNVKPGKLRDVMSAGLVLCASSQDHSIVEPLLPPEDAKIGEQVTFAGHEGKPEEVLNPKKKQLEKITPHLYTDGKGVATYKGVPFMTSAGFCCSSIHSASIK